jgi:hypothetical protein
MRCAKSSVAHLLHTYAVRNYKQKYRQHRKSVGCWTMWQHAHTLCVIGQCSSQCSTQCYVLGNVPHFVTLMCWTQRARFKLSFTCPQSKPKGVRAVRCLSVRSSAKSYKLTFVLSHPNYLQANYPIHKNVQRRAGTATHSVSSSITCFATAIFQAAVATAHAAQALPIWQTKIVPLPTPPR